MNPGITAVIGQQNPYHEKFNRFFLPYRRAYDAVFYSDGLGELEEVNDYGFPLVNEEAINAFIALRIQQCPQLSNFSTDLLTERLGLMRNDRPTKMAVLLFGQAPDIIFPNFSIRITVYETMDRKRIGERRRIFESLRIDGTIPEMVDIALRCIRRYLRTRVYVTGAVRHKERLEVPEAILREVILNALVHRDYSRPAESLPTEIDIFPNRIEVVSPGPLYRDLSVEYQRDGICPHRNEHLVCALEQMHQIKNRGSGIPMIQKTMESEGLPKPRFISEGDRFIVILGRPSL